MTQRGCFITLEGVDGAGKSTHVEWIAGRLRTAGVDLLCTREPGGTPLGEQLRAILLHHPMEAGTEALLMFAARHEHWQTCILPALRQGRWVLCDRYTDASYAYQGGGRSLGADRVRVLEDWVQQGRGPDCTILFDVPLAVARERLRSGRDAADRFEQEDMAFFERTRQAYLDRVHADPARFRVLDTSHSVAQTQSTLAGILDELLREHGHTAGGDGQ